MRRRHAEHRVRGWFVQPRADVQQMFQRVVVERFQSGGHDQSVHQVSARRPRVQDAGAGVHDHVRRGDLDPARQVPDAAQRPESVLHDHGDPSQEARAQNRVRAGQRVVSRGAAVVPSQRRVQVLLAVEERRPGEDLRRRADAGVEVQEPVGVRAHHRRPADQDAVGLLRQRARRGTVLHLRGVGARGTPAQAPPRRRAVGRAAPLAARRRFHFPAQEERGPRVETGADSLFGSRRRTAFGERLRKFYLHITSVILLLLLLSSS